MKSIGVEKGLKNIADFLADQGYSVQTVTEGIVSNASALEQFDVIITAGYNTDVLGYSDTVTNVPVIDARGLTPQEVKAIVDQEMNK